ncbi:MAG: hypothetical protein HYZ53_30160 [Planctomycetes bacterium]|nr:hypothetical protein [Planctomycetota bacterium]
MGRDPLKLSAAAVALLALAALSRAWGDDPPKTPTPEEKLRQSYESRLRDRSRDAASARVAAAEFCYGKKLYEVAALEYELALKLDPTNAKAHERLGYKKTAAGWEEKPSGTAKRKNECPANEVNNLTSDYNDRTRKTYPKIADEFFELGKWCRERKLEEEAKGAWREALGFAPDHAKAREALGFKKEGDKWVSADDRAAADAMKKKVAGAKEGEEIAQPSEDEKKLGFPLAKRKGAHFVLQAAFGQDDVKEWMKLAEAAFDDFHALLEVPADHPVVEEPITGFLLDTKSQHEAYVDKLTDGSPGQKDFMKKGGGQVEFSPPRFEGWKGGAAKEELADITVHMSVHVLFQYYMALGADNVMPWLYESMAYTFTVRLRRSALTHCITQSTGGGGKEEMPRDAGHWKQAMKESVRKGQDPAVDRMLTAGINSIQGDLLLKGWSMLDWMLATRKEAFLKFLSTMKEAPKDGKAQLTAWKAAFGKSPEECEVEWRAWVLSTY